MSQPKDWLDKLFTRTTPNNKDLQAHYGWQQGDTAYEWYGNGMLKSVRTPEGATIRFEYDALGRRTLKETHDTCHRYAWDGNVLLHEWSYDRREKPRMEKDELGRIRYDRQEPHTNLITWVYDGGSYTPVAKLTEEDSYTIVQDYLGTPIQALDSKGEVVWDCILDIYGDVLELRGKRDFIPFRFQGQYADVETGLYYNRFRYYSPELGNYISQDPIRMAGNNPTLYGYVKDTNSWLDPFGLDCSTNAKRLRENMAKEGRVVGAGEAAGHIVASCGSKKHFAPSVESRSLLEKYNIDINDAANGIPIGHPNPHGFMHTKSFHSYVKERLYSVEKKMHLSGMGKKATRSAIRKELRNIGKDVLKKIK